ncbi:hypothetical protein JVX91_22990 [Pseudomonas sp. PDNC002]|uniref:hypothetical protein n=1 Tax=Pseudomonas sp. PDNC002 TaxID=2811422 RepID=UPI00196664A9|nr:hypothetical protein [Pseudomonas sp. PDNC002]QRY78423.1 hypothetical protein JVX91_22990 [Pseudomonas sp. PDNC002]
MSIALRSTTLVALLFSGQLMAQGGIIRFSGEVVEPTCEVGLSDVTAHSARVRLSECSQSLYMQLSEPRSAMPSVNYRLTDVRGRALGRDLKATGNTDSVIRAIQKNGSAAGNRNVVLVAEYI